VKERTKAFLILVIIKKISDIPWQRKRMPVGSS
jgi:hypothetical protein